MRALVLATLVAGCSAPPPSWHVSGGQLRSPDGRAAILRGVNLSGTQKQRPYLDDKQADDYLRIRRDWGLNAVRFVMTWAAVEPQRGQYDDAYLSEVAVRLGWAQAAGLQVVLDMHEDIYGEGFGYDGAARWTCDASRYQAFQPRDPWFLNALEPNVMACVDSFWTDADLQQRFTDAWRHVAERLHGAPAVIGFDVLNEPAWGSYSIFDFETDRLTPTYERVVAAVRGAAPGWVAFLEPSASRNEGIATGLQPFRFADVVYAPHSYDQNAEGGGGFDPTHRQAILDNLAKLAAEARTLKAALWIGEYGGDASAPGIADYMGAQYDGAGAQAASTMYWAYDKSDGYGLLAPDGSEKPALLDAIVRPYPEYIAGDPISYAWDVASSTFTFTYSPARTGVTELSVPARRYPNGYQVECGGCTFDQPAGALRILTPPTASPAVITVHP